MKVVLVSVIVLFSVFDQFCHVEGTQKTTAPTPSSQAGPRVLTMAQVLSSSSRNTQAEIRDSSETNQHLRSSICRCRECSKQAAPVSVTSARLTAPLPPAPVTKTDTGYILIESNAPKQVSKLEDLSNSDQEYTYKNFIDKFTDVSDPLRHSEKNEIRDLFRMDLQKDWNSILQYPPQLELELPEGQVESSFYNAKTYDDDLGFQISKVVACNLRITELNRSLIEGIKSISDKAIMAYPKEYIKLSKKDIGQVHGYKVISAIKNPMNAMKENLYRQLKENLDKIEQSKKIFYRERGKVSRDMKSTVLSWMEKSHKLNAFNPIMERHKTDLEDAVVTIRLIEILREDFVKFMSGSRSDAPGVKLLDPLKTAFALSKKYV